MNCGILALSKIKEMKGASAFTLIHLGKDNGVDLKLFKVKEKDLPLVHRPAIFHSENHFEYIQNGEPLPDYKWTGFVLTEKSIGRPISHKEAKTIKGQWGFWASVWSAITFVAKKILPSAFGSAAVKAGTAAIAGEDPGKAAISGLKSGALTAGAYEGLTAVSGKLGPDSIVGKFLASAVDPKNAATTKGVIGAGVGATGVAGGPGGLAGAVGEGMTQYGVQTIGDTIYNAYNKTFPGTESAGGVDVPGETPGGKTPPVYDPKSVTWTDKFKSSMGQALTAGAVGLAAKSLGPKGPEGITFDPVAEYSNLRNVLGTQGLPPSTEAQILKDVNTPLADMAKEFSPASDRTLRQINQAFDLQTQNLSRQFAQAGQNMRNSSEFRAEMQKIEQQRATVLGEAEQEAFNTGLQQAVQSKQFALNASIQAQQFDLNLALELADAIGQKEMFNAAIEQQDEAQFNSLLAQILNIGFSGQDNELEKLQKDWYKKSLEKQVAEV